MTFAKRGITDEPFETTRRVVINEAAVRVEIKRCRRGEFGAVDSGCTELCSHLGRVGCSVQMHFAGKVSPPTRIGSKNEFAQLAQLCLSPLEVEMHRHLPQFRCAEQPCLQLQDSGIAEIKAYIGAGGLASQANAPVSRIFLPEGKVGAHEGKREFLKSLLNVYARVGCFKIGDRKWFVVVFGVSL